MRPFFVRISISYERTLSSQLGSPGCETSPPWSFSTNSNLCSSGLFWTASMSVDSTYLYTILSLLALPGAHLPALPLLPVRGGERVYLTHSPKHHCLPLLPHLRSLHFARVSSRSHSDNSSSGSPSDSHQMPPLSYVTPKPRYSGGPGIGDRTCWA